MTADKYTETSAKRKRAHARVRVWPASKNTYAVNNLNLEDYFKLERDRIVAKLPLSSGKVEQKFKVSAHLNGGGVASQASAMMTALARAIVAFDATSRKVIKKEGWLKVDSRNKERRKFGLKKARKAPQWSKR